MLQPQNPKTPEMCFNIKLYLLMAEKRKQPHINYKDMNRHGFKKQDGDEL